VQPLSVYIGREFPGSYIFGFYVQRLRGGAVFFDHGGGGGGGVRGRARGN